MLMNRSHGLERKAILVAIVVTAANTVPSRAEGPDVTFCQLYGLNQYGRSGDIVGLAMATTSWNVGTSDLMWFEIPDTRHPLIVQNLFRLKDDRFEQIGQSWIKHGFYALSDTQCGGECTYEPGHGEGPWLGTGCTDTYDANLNANRNVLGPRSEVNPWTAGWTYPGSHLSVPHAHPDGILHRLQVHDADLNPPQNPGAAYFAEGFYVTSDDVNVMNSASWKSVTVNSGAPGGTWTFGMSNASVQPTIGFAIDAWTGAQQTILAQEVPPVEFTSPDGRCILAAKATDLGNNVWHYEYALYNVDMNRKVGSFSIPVSETTNVTNVGFHAVESHNEPFSNTAWSSTVANGAVTWTTADNPIRWGTLYNFRFDADSPPATQRQGVTVTLGLFEPGTPTTVTGITTGPSPVADVPAISSWRLPLLGWSVALIGAIVLCRRGKGARLSAG